MADSSEGRESRSDRIGVTSGIRPASTGELNSAPGIEPHVELVNKTARRIRIKRKDREGDLVVAPFNVVKLAQKEFDQLHYRLWIERGYIETRSPVQEDEDGLEPSSLAAIMVVLLLTGLATYVTESTVPLWVGGSLALLTLVPEIASRLKHRKPEGESLILRAWRALGMLGITVVGYGIPLGAVFLQMGVQFKDLPQQPVRVLAVLSVFALFVGSAATLPAMLFFLFAEQRRLVVKEQFHRDVLRLDPALRTIDEAERVYAPLMKDALETRRGPLFFAPLIISTFLLALGWVVAALPSAQAVQDLHTKSPPAELHTLFIPVPTPFTFAFLGTYFFALNMVFRRYVRADLGPKAYSHVAVRIVIASILAWVASRTYEGFDWAPAGSGVPWQLLLFAFFIGIVPETGMAVFHDLFKLKAFTYFVPTLENPDPLTKLEGITLYDKARLLEEGIENIENLAHHNLVDLILRTRIPAPRLVDLVDQAVLYLHVRDLPNAEKDKPENLLGRFKAHGIRTATDLEHSTNSLGPNTLEKRLLPDEPERLRVILSALRDDEWMPQLRAWRDFRQSYEGVYSIDELSEPLRPQGQRDAGQ